MALLLDSGGLVPMSQRTDWISHLAHNGKLMACDILAIADDRPAPAATLAATPAATPTIAPINAATCCRLEVGDWSLGGTAAWLTRTQP